MALAQRIAAFLTRKGWNPRVIRAGSRFHKFLFRTLGLGRFRFVGEHSLILTTRGRRTGRETSTPLFYAEDHGRFYIAASFAGSGQPPNWFLNLVAHPDVVVEMRRARNRCGARVLDEAEANQVWPRLDAVYPTFAAYRKRTSRTIHVIELSPIDGSGPAAHTAQASAA